MVYPFIFILGISQVLPKDYVKQVNIELILREMVMSQKNYFKLNKENSKDGRYHFFYFKIEMSDECKTVRKYQYLQVFSTIQ